MYELINKQFIEVKEYKYNRVLTLNDIDILHQRPKGTARKRFNDNKEYFIEGVDYFKVCASEIRTHKIMDISPKTHEDIILLTESGYLMIVKSFTDELAWKVQRQLVNTYFRSRQQNNYSDIDQSAIITTIKELCEKVNSLSEENKILNYKIDQLNNQISRLSKENLEFTVIIRMICGIIFKKQSRKSKSKEKY